MNAIIEFFKRLFGIETIKEEHVEPVKPVQSVKEVVPKEVQKCFDAMLESGKFSNPRYIAEIDMSINSAHKRLFIYDRVEKKLFKHKVAHGKGKGTHPHNGKIPAFSNVVNSHLSCAGLFKCAETYHGGSGYSMRIDGLYPTNSNARSRYIVVHGSDYVVDSSSSICGRSFGCPSLDWKYYKQIIDILKNGSPLLIHYAGKYYYP